VKNSSDPSPALIPSGRIFPIGMTNVSVAAGSLVGACVSDTAGSSVGALFSATEGSSGGVSTSPSTGAWVGSVSPLSGDTASPTGAGALPLPGDGSGAGSLASLGDGALSIVSTDEGGLLSVEGSLSMDGSFGAFVAEDFDDPLDAADGELGLDSLISLVDDPFDEEETVLLPEPFEFSLDVLTLLPVDALELFDPPFPLPLDDVLLGVAFNFLLLISLLDPLFFSLTIL